MIKRLRVKFVCINMGIITAMLLVIFGMVLYFTRENLEHQSIRMMQSIVMNDKPGRERERREDIQLPYFRVDISRTGEVRFDTNGYLALEDEKAARTLILTVLDFEEDMGVLPEYQLRYQRWETPFGQSVILVDISSEYATINDLVKTCVLVGVSIFMVFLGLSFLLAGWAVSPMETAWNQQRQFVADASHELKTPLTVILTNAELLKSAECEETERKGFVDSILIMSHQMRGLVENLLELARVDNGTVKMVFSEFDLSEMVAEALLTFEPVYFEKELLLESEVEPGLRVKGALSHLRQVLDILLDNAVKYSSAGGTVRVALRRQRNGYLLSVASPGETISREDLKNIFKRFYRIDKARAMNHSYGLGLSIAESIVKEHDGRIWAESRDGVNTFYVQMNGI